MSFSEELDINKKLIQEKNMLSANTRIANAASNENQWLSANKAIFVSSRRVDLLKQLSLNDDQNSKKTTPTAVSKSGSNISKKSFSNISKNSKSNLNIKAKFATVLLKITLPFIWFDGLKTPGTIYVDKSSQKKTNSNHSYYLFFEALYGENIKESEGQILDTSRCNISPFSIRLENVCLDTYIEISLWAWAYNYNDIRKSRSNSKNGRNQLNTHNVTDKNYNFVKYAVISLTLKDALDKPYVHSMKKQTSNFELSNYLDLNDLVSITARPFPNIIKYSDIHPYAVYLNENIKCHIGFQDDTMHLYTNKFSNEPIPNYSFKLSDITKCRFDSKNKQVVKIKYGPNTYAFHLQTEEIAENLVNNIENFLDAREEWGSTISDFNRVDLTAFVSDISKIPATYMEYIDQALDNFAIKYESLKKI